MGRIRTIKPEFFKHEELFDAEQESGLPLRLAFAGLWTVCDREGRFEWKVRALKTDILPYDEVDFSRVLDALMTRGFIARYRVGEREYGFVPGFARHQVINNRESSSQIPPPPENPSPPKVSSREARVDDASTTRHDLAQGEGKGREGKGTVASATAAATGAQPQPHDGDAEDDPESWTDDRLWEEVLAAVGLQGPQIPTHWQAPGGIRHVGRWRHQLGIPCRLIVAESRASRANHADPPNGPKALDGVMKRLASDLEAEPMRAETRRPNGARPGQEQPETPEQRRARWARMAGHVSDPPAKAGTAP